MPDPSSPDPSPRAAGADPDELRRFAELADRWWDEEGPWRPCTSSIRPASPTSGSGSARASAAIRTTSGRSRGSAAVDVGCGGGLLCEPLARLGAAVTGIDPARRNLAVAARHAASVGLAITYREIAVEQLAAEGHTSDLVCVMEVVEHVPDMPAFLAACGRLVRPGGGLVLATLNRTFRSFALGIVAAEYVLGWLPRGTHRWSRFVRPSEAARALRRAGLSVADLTGVSYDPLRDRFRLSPDPAVNYMLFAVRD